MYRPKFHPRNELFAPSFSFLKLLADRGSPNRAVELWLRDEPWTETQIVGLAVERGLLEGGLDEFLPIDLPYPDKDYRTKANREARDEAIVEARTYEKHAIRRDVLERAFQKGRQIRESILGHPTILEDPLREGELDVVLSGEIDGIGYNGHPDLVLLDDDFDLFRSKIIDVKTTTNVGRPFARQILSNYTDVQLAGYMELARASLGIVIAVNVDSDLPDWSIHTMERGSDSFVAARETLSAWLSYFRSIDDDDLWDRADGHLNVFGREFPTRYHRDV